MTEDDGHAHSPDGRTLTLEEFLPYRLTVLAETVSHSLARYYSHRYGIGIPEWRVLATLGQFGPMTAKAVGEHSHMHKTKVSRAVAALEAKHMVRRHANPSDKREAFLRLTGDGHATYDALVPSALDFSEALQSVLSHEERKVFDTALNRLIACAETLTLDEE